MIRRLPFQQWCDACRLSLYRDAEMRALTAHETAAAMRLAAALERAANPFRPQTLRPPA